MRIKQAKEDLEDVLVERFHAAPNRLERMKAVIVFDELRVLLSNDEDEYFKKLEKAFSLVYKMSVESEAVSLISNIISGCERMGYARQIWQDMHFVFDDFLMINRELQNAAYAKRQQHYASVARKLATTAQDFDYISKIEERAAKAGQYALPPNLEEGEILLPKLLIITDSPSVFEAQKNGEVIDFEDLKRENGIDETSNEYLDE